MFSPPNEQKVKGIDNATYYYNTAIAMAKDIRHYRKEKTYPAHLRISFDFTDADMHPIRPNLEAFTGFSVPLDCIAQNIGHKDMETIKTAVEDMLIRLVKSGSIRHLCPEIQGKNQELLTENYEHNSSERFLTVLNSDTKIRYRDEIDRLYQVRGRLSIPVLDVSFENHPNKEKT